MSIFIPHGSGCCGQLEFVLVSLDPGGAKKSGVKAEKDHVPSRFSLTHLASIIIHCLQGEEGIPIYTLGIFSCYAKNPSAQSHLTSTHLKDCFCPKYVFFPSSLPTFLLSSFPPFLHSLLKKKAALKRLVLNDLQGY